MSRRAWFASFALTAALTAALAVPHARADSAGPLVELVDALAERLQIAEPVAAFKWGTHGDIEDPARVEQEFVALRDDAAAAQIDADYVVSVFKDQINATEAIEYTRFAQWKLNPAGVPPAPPDLAASRAAIDTLNNKILSQITLNWGLLHGPLCAAELAAAKATAIGAHQLDDLYQQALTTATRSYCQAGSPV